MRWFLFVAALFRKSNWRGRVEILRILLPALPGLVWLLLKVIVPCIRAAPKIIRVMLAERSVRIADEKRRLAVRWKPERGRKP